MSDFGTEMGNSGLSLMGKLMDALLKLLSKIFDTIKERTGADYKLKKTELREMKSKASQRKFVEKIEGKTGFVNHKDLERAGVPLTAVGITLDEKGMKELADRCKRAGIVITGVEDIRERELNGNKSFILECKQSDLHKLAKLIDLMNDEKKIDKTKEEIDKLEEKNNELKQEAEVIKEKDGELSQEDKERLSEIENEIEENDLVADELFKQISDIREGNSQELNGEQAQGVCEKAVNGKTERGVTFDEAVDRWTGGSIDKDITCYVVDAKDPSKYIVCNAKNDTFRGGDYIKTTYEVYNGSKQIYATNDRRFEGRPKDYWMQQKAAMKEMGGFGDMVIKFYSLKEVEAYRENYKTENEIELNDLHIGKEDRDYEAIIKSLEAKIEKCGGEYKDGVVIDKETGKAMTLTDSMSDKDKAKIAEASVMGKQIVNYEELAKLESEIGIARSETLITIDGTVESKKAQEAFGKVQEKYKAALETEANLIDERKSINAVQAEQGVKFSSVKNIEYLPQDKVKITELANKIAEQEAYNSNYAQEISCSEDYKRKDSMYKELSGMEKKVNDMRGDLEQLKSQAIKNAQEAEKTDNRREERVDNVNDTHHAMDEYKGEIENKKKKDGAKGNDIKDRETVKDKSIPKEKGDR